MTGLGATYTVHLRLIGKLVDLVDFLFILIEFFSVPVGVTAEVLRSNIDRKSAFFAPTGSV